MKLYYYKGTQGHRWKLEGPLGSYLAADDLPSPKDLKDFVDSLREETEVDSSDYGASSYTLFFRTRLDGLLAG